MSVRNMSTMPAPADDYAEEEPTILPPPPSMPRNVIESGVQTSDLVGENIRLRMLLSRVVNARVCEMQSICEDIRSELTHM